LGGVILSVDPGGTGAELGLRPGDEVISVGGVPLRDEIDYRYAVAEEEVVLVVRRTSCETIEYEVEKDIDDALGVAFAGPVFDGVRECNNRCVFCFVDQMPPGARRSTLVHDDDYRLSFLGGNFVTLTNLADAEIERIVTQRLSPLYVSIHAVDPQVRRRLFRSRHAHCGIEVLERLLAAGIRVHAQIVMVPGYNDGLALDETVGYLAARHPGVRSVGIVPVGLTAHRAGLAPLEPVSSELAGATLAQVRRWQGELLPRLGTRFCFAADELYLRAVEPFPPEAEYEDCPQEENGIGLCVPFLTELRRGLTGAPTGSRPDSLSGRPSARLAISRRVRHSPPRSPAAPATTPSPLAERANGPERGEWPRGEAVGRHAARQRGAHEQIVILSGTGAGPLIADVIHSCGLDASVRVLALANTYLGPSVTVAGLLAGRDLIAAVRAAGPALFVCPSVALNDEGLFLDDVSLEELRACARAVGGRLEPAGSALELAELLRKGCDET